MFGFGINSCLAAEKIKEKYNYGTLVFLSVNMNYAPLEVAEI